jgi:glycosyltransferase involved in cell wall biosynthesis
MSVLAVMTARNEAGYIATALRTLIEQGLEVVLIDHESIDGTREIAESFLGNGLLQIETLEWRGTYDLTALLQHQQEVYAAQRHDWFVRIDADEWLHPNVTVPLAEFLERHVDRRYAIVNFREYVFLPPVGVDMWGEDFRQIATTYYAFEPRQMRLMRAWRRGMAGSFIEGAGHAFAGVDQGLVLPTDQALRHYVGLSWSHAISKRADRSYAPQDLAKGWHYNRLDMRRARPLETAECLKHAEPWDTHQLDASRPSRVHFWDPGFH